MLKPIPSKPGLFSGALKQFSGFKGIAVSTLLTVGLVLAFVGTAAPQVASAATNNTLNFQARLETASGAIVPDGNYNVEFKLYNVSSGGSAEWTEDYLNSASQGVHVSNGYLTVNLGSITSFPTTINWDQQQWLTMNIGNNTSSCSPFSSCSPDGEMSPRLALTAVPYALRAGTLASTANASGFESTLSLLQPASGVTGNEVFQIPDMGAAGTYTLMTTTTGVQLQSTTPGTAQTGNFNISGTGILNTLDATSVNINTTTSQAVLTVQGTTSDSTALGLVVNDTNGNDILQVRNDGQVTIGKASGASSTIGKTNIGAHADTGYSGLVAVDKITTGPENATLNSISNYVGSPIDTTNNKYYLGVYADNSGTPGTLIATSSQGTLTANAWNTLPVSASLAANTSYWLAFFTNTTVGSDPYQYYDTTATTQHYFETGQTFSSGLPSTFTASGSSTTIHSIYASVSETGPLGTTLTVNPTTGATIITPTNTTTAFQVQNTAATTILDADTSNKVVSTLDLQVGSPVNANASRLFSDSFESGNFNLWPTVSGPAAIDTANVHTGKYAAKFSPAGSGQAYIQTHIGSSSTIDMRGYVYVSSQTTGSISFLTLCDSTCTNQLELYRDSATGKLAFYNSNIPSNTNGSVVMTTGAWHEIEADINVGSSGSVTVYLDGTSVLSQSGINTGSVNPTLLNAGDVGFGDTAVFSMDDISVDTVRPGDGGNLTVGDSLHVSGTSTFGESLTIQTTTDTIPALTIYNADGTAGLQIMSGGSGGNNTFIGLSSGQSNTVNTGSGTGIWNVSLGDSSLHANTTGYDNTAVGGQAMQSNTTGFDNSAFGLNALQNNTSGTYNTGVGWEVLMNNTSGTSNSAIGLAALQSNTTGANNTGVGQSALQNNHTANDSTAVGYQALLNNNSGSTGGANNTGIGQYALLDNTSGSDLTGVGWGAGASGTTGSYDTYLGYNTGNIDQDAFGTPATLQNATAIGAQAQVQASNSLVLGATGSNQVNVGIGTTIPLDTFSVSPLDYNTGQAAVSSAGTTVTGTSTYWRPSMVGEQFIFANGQTGIITAVSSYTSLTLNASQPITAASNYRIQQIGMQVSSAGTVGIGTYSPTAKLQVASNATDTTLLQVSSNSGGSIAQVDANGDVNLGGTVTSNTVGLTTTGSTNAGGYGGIISAQKVTTGATGGTVASMSTQLIGTSSGSNIQFGIYADNGSGYPGALVATSSVGSPVLGTNTLPISATLSANTSYWFVYWTNGTNNNNTYNSGSPANNWYYVSYGWPCASSCTNSMPNSFPGGGTGLGITFNVWATYEPSSDMRITGSTGAATFENTANNTNAFQIQNASGTNLINVDTSASEINLGTGPTPPALGYTTIGGTAGSTYNGYITSDKFTAGYSGTLASMSVYVGGTIQASPNNKYQVAIYADNAGVPGAYIASSAVSTLNSSASWNTAAINAYVSAGSSYWLVYWTNTTSGSDNVMFYNTVAGASGYYATSTFGAGADNGMPATFPSGSTQSNVHHSIYATYASGFGLMIGSSGALTENASAVFADETNSTTAVQIQNSSGQALFTADTQNNAIVLGADATPYALTVRGGAASGSNISGANLTFDASNGTGAAGSGAIVFRTASGNSGTLVTKDTANKTDCQNATTCTYTSFAVNQSNTNRLLVVGINIDSTAAFRSVNTVTYAGVSLTKLANVNCPTDTDKCDDEVWFLRNPTNATGNVVVNTNGAGDIGVGILSLYNVDQTNTFPLQASNSGTSSTASVTVSGTNTNQLVLDVLGGIGDTWTQNASQTKQWFVNNWTDSSGGSTKAAGNGSTSMSWTDSGTTDWAELGIAINPVGGTTADTLTDRLHIDQLGNVGIDNASPQYTLDVAGTARVQSATNSTTAFQTQNASAATVFDVDTTNNQIGINTNAPAATLDVQSSATTSNAVNVNASSLTTGSALNISTGATNNLTTGNLVNIATASNAQSAGSLLNVSDTATLSTSGSSINGSLINVSRNLTSNISGSSTGTPTLDHGSTFATYPAAAGQTDSFTVNTGHSNYYMVIGVFDDLGQPAPTVTYAGTTASLLQSGGIGNGSTGVYLYGLKAPATGTNNLVLTTTGGSGEWSVAVEDFYNVNQSTPNGTPPAHTEGTSNVPPASITATSVSGDTVTDFLAETTPPVTPTSGQTQADYSGNLTMTYGPGTVSQSYKVATGTSTTMQWSNPTWWGMLAVDLKGASTSAASVTSSVAAINNNCTTTAGSCTDASSVLSLNQQYSGSTGAVLNIQNSGSGDELDLLSGSSNLMKVSSTGATKFQVSTNSTTAFQVQNAGGTNLFLIDSTNNIITIGNGSTNIILYGSVTSGTISAIQPGTLTTAETWHKCSIPSGWTDNSTTGTNGFEYRLLPTGDVEMSVNMIGPSGGAHGATVCTLPSGYYDTTNTQNINFATSIVTASDGQSAHFNIATNGVVKAYGIAASPVISGTGDYPINQ